MLFHSDYCNVTNRFPAHLVPYGPCRHPPPTTNITLHHHHHQRMTPPTTTISCLQCTDLGHECYVRRRVTDIVCLSTYLCIECEAAGIDTCVFPPSLRHLRRIKSACSSCMHVHQKCIFVDDGDTQCIRCNQRGLLCVFELNGMLLEYYHFIFVL